MNDQELDALIAAAATPQPGRVESLPLGGPAIELRELIMTTTDNETTTDDDVDHRVLHHRPSTGRLTSERRTRRVRRLAIVAVAAAAATAVTVGLVTTTGGGTAPNSAQSAYADELVAVAEAAPRMLVTADGWGVGWASEFGAENGGIRFSNGDEALDLLWRPVAEHQTYVDDRAANADALGDITMGGHDATLFRYSNSNDFTALWIDGDHSVELRGVQPSEADFRALAATVEAVDVETWLDAMPESVIAPSERDTAIADILVGVPVPPGFDQTVLDSSGISDRYQLAAEVTGWVACGWLDIWVDADARGDQTAKAEATRAMASSRTWPILLEMEPVGPVPYMIWEYADDLATDGVNSAYGDRIRTREYVQAFGCTG